MPGTIAPVTRTGPRWVPNALVWLRLVLAAVFIALLTGSPLERPGVLWASVAVFVIAALTDMLDGRLARAWDAVSRFGRVMDPFADKVLVLGAFVCLAGPAFEAEVRLGVEVERSVQASGVRAWMAVVILAREMLVTSMRALAEGEGQDFSAVRSGKLKMVAQSVGVPLIIATLALGAWRPGEWGRAVIDATAWTMVGVTVVSGVPYVRKFFARGGEEHGR